MAIVITRGFNKFPDTTIPLLSAHLPASIEFTLDRGSQVNTYAVVTINGYDFRAVKTKTTGSIDTYQLGGEMLISLLGTPDINPTSVSSLQLAIVVVCKGYSSNGTLLDSKTHPPFKICHAISADRTYGLIGVQSEGRSTKIYHNGVISYFDVINQQYKITSTSLTGLFTQDGTAIQLVFLGELFNWNLAWLNIDGCWDFSNFTRISTTKTSNLSRPISLYSSQLHQWRGYQQSIGNEVEEEITYRVIAKDAAHYTQLYFMAQSPLIMNNEGELFEMAQKPAPLGSFKQNLNFTFSVKRKYHAQSF